MSPDQQRAQLEAKAKELGVEALGVAEVSAELKAEYFKQWIAEGQHGAMAWMDTPKRTQPQAVLPECQSVVVVGLNYFQKPKRNASEGHIATYALGRDYHKVLSKKLESLVALMESWGGKQRAYVDTGPVIEKRFAAATILGWQGKSTMLISPSYGPWLSLGVILTTLTLPADKPHADRCGSCTRCIAACPTHAITAPYQLDARKCIAYLTIEHKGAIPVEYRKAIGARLFGCEECLSVCPWNKFAQTTHEADYAARNYPTALEVLSLSQENFEATFNGTPIRRLGLERLKRNACVVLGNTAGENVLPTLEALSQSYEGKPDEAGVDEMAQWAMAEITKRAQ